MKSEKEIRETKEQARKIYNYATRHYIKPEVEQEALKNEMFAFISGLEFALGTKKTNYWFKAFQQARKEARKLGVL
jgi:hypothetical protein